VAGKLKTLGYLIQTGVGKIGIVATLKGRAPGNIIAIRADMDALPVTENTDLPFQSTQKATYLGREAGVAHACGHDIHSAVLLGVAQFLNATKDQWNGTVKLIFQGAVEGGSRFNIIPDQVSMTGTVRTLNPDVQGMLEKRMNEVISGVTKAYGGDYQFDYERGNPVTVNHPGLARFARQSLMRTLGGENAHEMEPTMGTEDFAHFANKIPGFYFRLGVVKPGTISGELHMQISGLTTAPLMSAFGL